MEVQSKEMVVEVAGFAVLLTPVGWGVVWAGVVKNGSRTEGGRFSLREVFDVREITIPFPFDGSPAS